jgi:hypothetical protein
MVGELKGISVNIVGVMDVAPAAMFVSGTLKGMRFARDWKKAVRTLSVDPRPGCSKGSGMDLLLSQSMKHDGADKVNQGQSRQNPLTNRPGHALSRARLDDHERVESSLDDEVARFDRWLRFAVDGWPLHGLQ